MQNRLQEIGSWIVIIVFLVANGCNSGTTTAPITVSQDILTHTPRYELNGILSTRDLRVGTNRISFLLTTPNSFVMTPSAKVKSIFLGNNDTIHESVTARFFLWPLGSRGSYVTEMSFSKPGDWLLEVDVQQENGSIKTAQIPLTITEASVTPDLDSKPPMVVNKTRRDVSDLTSLTTRSIPHPDLYKLTIREAINTEKPLLLVIASPALCTSPTCGPQVETVEYLQSEYKSRANFIHVEVYDNPNEVQENLSQARYASIVDAWHLTKLKDYQNESWVFILDNRGHITSKYEGYATKKELQEGLEKVLSQIHRNANP